MKTVLKSLKYYALIPLIASIPGLAIGLCGSLWIAAIIVPAVTAGIYILLRKKLDTAFAMKANGAIFLGLMVIFTVMMIIAKGSVSGIIMSYFSYLILPFAPVILLMALMGDYLTLYACAMVTYLVAFMVCACCEKVSIKKIIVPAMAVILCVAVSTAFYINRPEVKYGGHGFDYMNGYSSTDFTDYTVYAENSKLVTLDHEPSFKIENEEDMPVLDGAEACYPLYAAFAKAVYKDIDKIELEYDDYEVKYRNGKIVTMTNTINAFERLIYTEEEQDGPRVDMFFGARPSSDQMQMAKDFGVEIEITPIGREAFVFFVEADNPIDGLTSEQVRAIYHGDITNWKELGGKDQEIVAFQRPENSGSQTMMKYFMSDVALQEPETYEKVDAMAGVITQVAQYNNEAGAMGYSFRYFLEGLNQEEGVKVLSIDGIKPTIENIENGTYPLTTNLCLVTRKGETNPNVEKMKNFILSADGQEIIRKTGYGGL